MNQTFEFLKHQVANVWHLYFINYLNDESLIKTKKNISVHRLIVAALVEIRYAESR